MKYTPSVVNLIIGGIEVKSFPSGTGITLEFCQLYPFGYGINIFFRLSSNGTLIILDIDKFLRLSKELDNLSGIKEYNYLYVNRTNNYPQNIGDTIVLSESYSKYHFINIEVVNSGIFREYLIPTQELTQIENLNYKYNINGFILRPSKDGTTLSIVDIPKDGYKKLNIIAGILKK